MSLESSKKHNSTNQAGRGLQTLSMQRLASGLLSTSSANSLETETTEELLTVSNLQCDELKKGYYKMQDHRLSYLKYELYNLLLISI